MIVFNLLLIRTILIVDNPFKCDCHLKWLINWMSGDGKNKFNLPDQTKCFLQPNLPDEQPQQIAIKLLIKHMPECVNGGDKIMFTFNNFIVIIASIINLIRVIVI